MMAYGVSMKIILVKMFDGWDTEHRVYASIVQNTTGTLTDGLVMFDNLLNVKFVVPEEYYKENN